MHTVLLVTATPYVHGEDKQRTEGQDNFQQSSDPGVGVLPTLGSASIRNTWGLFPGSHPHIP